MGILTPLALPSRARGTHHFPQQDASLFSLPQHVIALIETSSFNSHAFTPQGLIQEASEQGENRLGYDAWTKSLGESRGSMRNADMGMSRRDRNDGIREPRRRH
jgi:hypothetical protein